MVVAKPDSSRGGSGSTTTTTTDSKCNMVEAETKCSNARTYGTAAMCRVPFTVLTYNLYPGPPVPYTAPDLFPHRIAQQIKCMRDLNVDIMCLQELYCPKAFAALIEAFPDYDYRWDAGFHVANDDARPWRMRPTPIPLVLLLATLGLALSALGLFVWRPFFILLVLLVGICVLLPPHSGLVAWLTHGGTGLAVLVRRDRADIVDHDVRYFKHQAGDVMNRIAWRGWTRTAIKFKPTCACGGSSRLGFVYNTHLNALGARGHRAIQADELACAITSTPFGKLVACGDYNEEPAFDSTVREFLEINCELMNADPSQTATYCPTRNRLAWCGGVVNKCLDHIYFKTGADAGLIPSLPTRVVFTDPALCLSDHYGVLASFE